ncbi:transposase [Streptomyces sp. JV185]|nr:transposase [Streptomyces sp. JV185]MEE1773766.1 transposase [Streptomyces sp. JV185]
MCDYVRGLLAPVAPKNSWRLAEQAGHATPDSLHSGIAGRAENCRIGVFAAYATDRGRALADRELCLPKSWAEDRERCRAAKVLDGRERATKGALARRMALRALGSPLPVTPGSPQIPFTDRRAASADCGSSRASATCWPCPSPSSPWGVPAPRVCSRRPWARRGSRSYAATARRDLASTTGWRCDCRLSPTSATRARSLTGCGGRARRSIREPDEIAYYLAYVPWEGGFFCRLRRASVAWISTKSVVTRVGTGTSPWRCSRTPSWQPRHTGPRERGWNR